MCRGHDRSPSRGNRETPRRGTRGAGDARQDGRGELQRLASAEGVLAGVRDVKESVSLENVVSFFLSFGLSAGEEAVTYPSSSLCSS